MCPIVFNCDNAYIMPTCVAIISILDNIESDEYADIYVLLSEKPSLQSEKYIVRLQSMYPNNNIIFTEVSEYVENAVMYGSHITSSTYLRLFIPWIFKEYDKCLFIDTDVIVNCDISKLLNINIEGVMIAGVKEYEINHNEKLKEKTYLRLDMKKDDLYLYAGMLLMNLSEFRRHLSPAIFEREIQVGYQFQDQDILNKHCVLSKKCVPLKYNFINRHINAQKLLDRNVYSEGEVQDTLEGKVIIHFPGKNKPWIYLKGKGGDVWWKYARKFLSLKEIERQYRIAEEYDRLITWYHLEECCDKYERIVVWGFSDIGKRVIDGLMKKSYVICCIGDNDEKKEGMTYKGYMVCGLEKVLEKIDDKTLIIQTSQMAYKNINEQLMRSGIKEDHILTYKNKGEIYYKSLCKEYYEDELKEILYREGGDVKTLCELHYDELITILKTRRFEWCSKLISMYNMEDWLLM